MRQKRKEDSVERTGGRLPEGVYTGPSLQSRSILYTVYTVERTYCFVTEKNFLPGRSQSKMIPFLWETWTVSFAFDSSIRTDITWYLILFFFYITKKGIPSIQGRVFFHFWYINLIHSDFEIINATEKEVWWSIHGAKLFFFPVLCICIFDYWYAETGRASKSANPTLMYRYKYRKMRRGSEVIREDSMPSPTRELNSTVRRLVFWRIPIFINQRRPMVFWSPISFVFFLLPSIFPVEARQRHQTKRGSRQAEQQ